MKALIATALALILALAALPSGANAPDPTYDQTRDWVVATISESAGYTRDATVVAYKDVSMDGCQLRFTTSTSTPAGYVDTESFIVSLDSVKNVLWGTVNNPSQGYVLFTTTVPIRFNKQRDWRALDRQPQTTNAATTVAALEFGKPGADSGEVASHMYAALLHAADLCKVQVAAR
jgi:hypothetical protein